MKEVCWKVAAARPRWHRQS